MRTDIVHTKGKEVFTDSKTISEMLEVNHQKVLQTIDRMFARQKNNIPHGTLKYPQKFIETTFTNKMGRTYKMFDLNEQAYLKLAMQLSGYEKAEIVQDQIIEAFSIMKEALLNQQNSSWIEKREETKQIRQNETNVIKDFVEYATQQGSSSAYRYYTNITKMTNKALELLVQTKHGKPLRNLATVTELGFIQVVDHRAMLAIEDGMKRKLPYQEIYKFAKTEVENLVNSLCFKSITNEQK